MARLVKEGDRFLSGRDVRLIGHDSTQHGIVPFSKAVLTAKEAELDLVVVADAANPPVCRVMNFGKFIYEQKKKEKDQRKAHHNQKQKEIKFSANIDPHDYQIKLNHAIDFLQKGYKLKVSMFFRGRELSHKEIGFGVMKKLIVDLEKFGVPEDKPKLIGKSIFLNFNPGNIKH